MHQNRGLYFKYRYLHILNKDLTNPVSLVPSGQLAPTVVQTRVFRQTGLRLISWPASSKDLAAFAARWTFLGFGVYTGYLSTGNKAMEFSGSNSLVHFAGKTHEYPNPDVLRGEVLQQALCLMPRSLS